MTQVSSTAIPAIAAALALTVLTTKGEVQLPGLPGEGGNTLDLREEGDVTFVDPNAKGQANRKEKIREAREDWKLTTIDVAFYSEASKKYGLIIRCLGCGVPVRKWTSDIHQSHRCDACTAKHKKATNKAKRGALKAALPGQTVAPVASAPVASAPATEPAEPADMSNEGDESQS